MKQIIFASVSILILSSCSIQKQASNLNGRSDEVYFTPLYYTMAHFSKFMRPGAIKIGCTINDKDIVTTAVKNPDGTIAVVVFNPTSEKQNIEIKLNNKIKIISIDGKALQTIIIKS